MLRKYSFILFFVAPLFIIAPIEVSYLVEANSIIYSGKEWKLIRDDNGELSSMIVDNDRNFSTAKTDYIFDRGDVAKINFFTHGKTVNKNDTIAVINSDVINQSIITLTTQLEIARANLNDSKTGEKPSVRDEFQERLNIAVNNVKFTKGQLTRAEKMVKEDLISELEYEQYKNAYDLAVINKGLAEKTLENVLTGEKPELVHVYQSQITSLKERLNILKAMKEKYVITAPFGGIINYYQDSVNLIKIKNPDDYLVKIPVKVYEIGYVDIGDSVECTIDRTDRVYNAVVTNIEDEIRVRGREQFFLVTATIKNPDQFIRPGMISRASIYSEDIPLYAFAKRKLGF
jgi:hypothetical protein